MTAVQCKAAVVREIGKISVETVTMMPPKEGEVMVKVMGCGVCQSDAHIVTGHIAMQLPIVLGHEGAGIISQLGPGVDNLQVGDNVVLSIFPVCGRCDMCAKGRTALCKEGIFKRVPIWLQHASGKPLPQMTGNGCMAEYTTLSALQCVKIAPMIPQSRWTRRP